MKFGRIFYPPWFDFRRLGGDFGENKRAQTHPNPVYEDLIRKHDQKGQEGEYEDVFENDQQYVKA